MNVNSSFQSQIITYSSIEGKKNQWIPVLPAPRKHRFSVNISMGSGVDFISFF